MSNLHKSVDGKWRTCTASKRACTLGGHVSQDAMSVVVSSLKNHTNSDAILGRGSKVRTLGQLSAQEIKAAAAKINTFNNANTPADLLMEKNAVRVPPVGVVFDLTRGSARQSKAGLALTHLVRDLKVSGTIETEDVKYKTEYGSQVRRLMANTVVRLSAEDNGDVRTVDVVQSRQALDVAPTVHQMLSKWLNRAGEAESPAREERLARVAGKPKRTQRQAVSILAQADTAKASLIGLFGEAKYKELLALK